MKNKYKGQPNNKDEIIIEIVSKFESKKSKIFIIKFESFLIFGTQISSLSKLFEFWWWDECVIFHEKYGTKKIECKKIPIILFNNLYFENDPWPHSCAKDQIPFKNYFKIYRRG